MSPTRPFTRFVVPRTFGQNRLGGRFAARVVLVAAVALFGQLASLAHLALVQHTRCAEHDALVHQSPDHAEPGTAIDIGTAIAALPAETGDHGDDHCLVAGLRRREVSAAAVPTPADLPSVRPLLPGLGQQQSDPHPIPLLARAPKSSPPAHA